MNYNAIFDNQKYCSRECRERETLLSRKIFCKECGFCGTSFISHKEKQIYCSKECSDKSRKSRNNYGLKIKKKICIFCKNEFETKSSFKIYCSTECGSKDRKIKLSSQREWDSLVEYCLERDGYKCSICGSEQGLVCHHVNPLAFGGSNDFSNLIILCSKCHGEAHRKINKSLK